MHPVEEYQDIITLTVDRLKECEIVTPTRRRWTVNYYITQFTGNSIIWGSDELERGCWIEEYVPERLGLQAPGWAAQENGKETQLWPIEWGVNMLQFYSDSNSLSHTTLSIKWEIYFSKELFRSSLLCRCVLHAYVYV